MQYISSRTIMGSDKVEKIVRPINCLIVGDDEYGKTYPFTRFGNLIFVLDELKNRNKARLPDFYDVSHAARGLVKLWSTYR